MRSLLLIKPKIYPLRTPCCTGNIHEPRMVVIGFLLHPLSASCLEAGFPSICIMLRFVFISFSRFEVYVYIWCFLFNFYSRTHAHSLGSVISGYAYNEKDNKYRQVNVDFRITLITFLANQDT